LRVARLGSVVAEIVGLDLHHRDSLAPGALEPLLDGAVDLILTNPPFAGEVVDAALCAAYPVTGGGRAERDALFLERCVGLLRPGGRLGIVLPHGRLVNDRDGALRDWLLRQVQVLAVVGLPDETFQPHTSLRTALVVGRKRPVPLDPAAPLPDETIHFCLSEKAGRDRGGRPIQRPGADPQAPAWLALDHDLNEVVDFIFDDLSAVWGAHG
jgi:type I restriction enzyme M protein